MKLRGALFLWLVVVAIIFAVAVTCQQRVSQ